MTMTKLILGVACGVLLAAGVFVLINGAGVSHEQHKQEQARERHELSAVNPYSLSAAG